MNLYLLSILDNITLLMRLVFILSVFCYASCLLSRTGMQPKKPSREDLDDPLMYDFDDKEEKEAYYKKLVRDYPREKREYIKFSNKMKKRERMAIAVAIITGAILILTPTRRSLMEAWAMTEVPAKVDRAMDILEKEYSE